MAVKSGSTESMIIMIVIPRLNISFQHILALRRKLHILTTAEKNKTKAKTNKYKVQQACYLAIF